MISLREIASKCYSLSERISVINHIFGFLIGSPKFISGKYISLKKQLKLIEGQFLDLNIILIGGDYFSLTKRKIIIGGIQYLRDIFAKAKIGIRKIGLYQIHSEDCQDRAGANQ